MAHAYFLIMVIGLPATLLAIALLAGHFYRGRDAELLDWQPTRSATTEVNLELGEIDQMLEAQNRSRRRRGLPERSLEDVIGREAASRERHRAAS
jgi:hypothetical protein